MPQEVPLNELAEAQRRPLVSLLTDFGGSEPFVGLVKARILAACPDASIVDLTHDLPPFAVEAGAFWIDRAFGYFPAGTVHLCVVDPGVGTPRRILVVEHAGQRFVAPDNGLLTGPARRPGAVVRSVDAGYLDATGLGRPSATFHGRDLFAPLAGRLAAGSAVPEDMGPAVTDWQALEAPAAQEEASVIRGRVLFPDRFGNLFSNIELSSINQPKIWEVRVAGRRLPWVRTYGDAPDGTLVVLENAFGVVEVSCVGGSAAALLGVGPGAEIELRRPAGPGPKGA